MNYQEHKLESGLTIRVATDDPRVMPTLIKYYTENSWHDWECPFCQGEIDSLTGEISEDDMFEDTYTCQEGCEALITLISPEGMPYHEVGDSEMIIEIEFMYGGTPDTWDNDEDEQSNMPPYDFEQPIQVDPDQQSFL